MGIIDFFLNLLSDPRGAIAGWIITLGAVWVYTPLFLIVFVETGLVFFPFLPGDSLLFAAGVFSADGGGLHLGATLLVFYAAAILGNTSNYWIARFFGKRIIDSGKVKALTPERMAKLDSFFEKYGGLTIVITRFMPFFRTFAPFIAGTGHMNFAKFTMSTTSGSMKCRLGNDWNSSSAGAGLCASNRLNEKNTGCSAAGPVSSHSASSKVGNAIQRPKPMKRVGRSLR